MGAVAIHPSARRASSLDWTEAMARDLLRNLPSSLLAPLDRLLSDSALEPGAVDAARITELQSRLPALIRFDAVAGSARLADPAAASALARALAWRRQADLTRAASAIAAIAAEVERGALAEALQRFESEGGAFFAHHHGLFEAQQAVALFPVEWRTTQESLVLAQAINAMKFGNYTHADYLVEVRFGKGAAHLPSVMAGRPKRSDQFAIFSFIRSVYAEIAIGEPELHFLFELLGRLTPDADLERGLLHNAALDALLRRRAWAMAEETATQALFHFRRLGAPLSSFYIGLYKVVILLGRGELENARVALAEAGQELLSLPSVSPNDALILHALTLICDYERGEHQPLVEFALAAGAGNPFGEIWPSVAEPIISYASTALATYVGLASARAYLARWRVGEFNSERTFHFLAMQEVNLLQAHGRWQEAAELLSGLTRRGSGDARQAAAAGETLSPVEQIELTLAALRDRTERDPTDAEALPTLAALQRGPELSVRQRAQASLLEAQVALRAGEAERLRGAMFDLLGTIVERGLVALHAENRDAIQKLLGDRRSRALLGASSKLARLLRRLGEMVGPQASRTSELTGQEMRILLLLAEQVPNKVIAMRLGVSVPTVRFHLGNVYRKLGCSRRREAVEIGLARGLLAA